MKKPDGLTILSEDVRRARLERLPLSDIPGVGRANQATSATVLSNVSTSAVADAETVGARPMNGASEFRVVNSRTSSWSPLTMPPTASLSVPLTMPARLVASVAGPSMISR